MKENVKDQPGRQSIKMYNYPESARKREYFHTQLNNENSDE